MAAEMPIGTATMTAINVTFKVPTINGKMPNWASLLENGSQVVPKIKSKNGTRVKNVTVSTINVKTMPMDVKTETEAMRNKIIGMIFSITFLFFLPFDCAIISCTDGRI